jgi:hypothetical protein
VFIPEIDCPSWMGQKNKEVLAKYTLPIGCAVIIVVLF